MTWYYANESKQQVPFSETDLPGLIEIGSINPSTLVWNPDLPDWREARSVRPDLFAASNRALSPTPYVPAHGQLAPSSTDGLALASLICGIFAVILTCTALAGLLPGIPAIICGHMARKKYRVHDPALTLPGHRENAGMAMAGLIMGYISSAITLLAIVVILLLFALAASSSL